MLRTRDAGKTATMSVLLSLLLAGPAFAGADSSYVGPLPYTRSADSPFDLGEFGFCVETFEDGKLSIPGATTNGSHVGSGGLTDSVDADDGVIDGSGNGGNTFFQQSGSITVEFDPSRTNGLPQSVGIVWTDGGASAPVTFEAFGPDNLSILPAPYGPFLHADTSNFGTTAEDRFYGALSTGGIRKIVISNSAGGIEVDHLQLDRCVVCGDANLDLRLTAPDALLALKTSVGAETCDLCICDTNNSTGISVSDALAILLTSVGLTPTMNCPVCPEFLPPT